MVTGKLKSRRGASILMGLLLLLVCAMAGAAAITSAASNAGRYTHLRRDQQRYLAVASAARLVRDELCAGTYEAQAAFTESYIYYTTTNPDTGAVSWHSRGPYYDLDENISSDYTGSLRPWLEDYAQELFQYRDIPQEWWGRSGGARPFAPDALRREDLAVQVDDAGGEEALNQVKWSLEMGTDYSITARFWLEETDESGNRSAYYATTLTIPAQVEASQSMSSESDRNTDRIITTQTVTVTWPEAGAVIRQS